jgi:hypothetical protein
MQMQEINSLVVSGKVLALNFSDDIFNEPSFLLENNKQLYFYGANDDILKHLVYTT